MAKREKKSFFWSPTAAQVKNLIHTEKVPSVTVESLDELASAVYDSAVTHQGKQAVILKGDLLADYTSALHARHHLPVMVLPQVSRPDFVQNDAIPDFQLPQSRFFRGLNAQVEPMQGVLASPSHKDYDGRTIRGQDLSPILYCWKDLFEGARILAYSKEMPAASIQYRDKRPNSSHVAFSVPSRTKGQRRYSVVLWTSMPMDMPNPTINNLAYGLQCAYTMRPDSGSEERRAYSPRNIGGRPYDVLNRSTPVMWHDFAALFWHMGQRMSAYRENKTANQNSQMPLVARFNPFPTVTQEAVDVYKVLLNTTISTADDNHYAHIPEAIINLGFGAYCVAHKDTAFIRPSYVKNSDSSYTSPPLVKLQDLNWNSPVVELAREVAKK